MTAEVEHTYDHLPGTAAASRVAVVVTVVVAEAE